MCGRVGAHMRQPCGTCGRYIWCMSMWPCKMGYMWYMWPVECGHGYTCAVSGDQREARSAGVWIASGRRGSLGLGAMARWHTTRVHTLESCRKSSRDSPRECSSEFDRRRLADRLFGGSKLLSLTLGVSRLVVEVFVFADPQVFAVAFRRFARATGLWPPHPVASQAGAADLKTVATPPTLPCPD